MPRRKPAKHAYTDWGLQRLHKKEAIYIAENERVELERVQINSKTIKIVHDKTKRI